MDNNVKDAKEALRFAQEILSWAVTEIAKH